MGRTNPSNMGRVRTRTTKRAAKHIVEKYYQRLTLDFATNKRICEEVASIQSKALRNKIAGYLTHLMKRIAKGPVRGISLKLQEEGRERRMDYIPDISAVDLEIEKGIEIDQDTKNMLRAMDMANLPGLNVVNHKERPRYGGNREGGNRDYQKRD